MARALTIERTVVGPAERARWLAAVRARREHYKRANCNYWVFEQTDAAGVFIEFTEAGSDAALRDARAAAPGVSDDAAAVYREADLSQLS